MFEAAEDVPWLFDEPLLSFEPGLPVPFCAFDEVPEDEELPEDVPEDWLPVGWPVPDSPVLPFDASASDEDESDDFWSSDDCAVDVDLSDDALPATCTVGTLLDCPRRYMTNAPPATTTATVTMMAMISATKNRDDGPLPVTAEVEEPDACAEADAGADDGTGTA